MLTVSGLSIHFGGRYLFKDISFNIGNNDRIGLIGRNGTGKSTLLKILSENEEPETGRIVKPKEYSIGYLPQEIETTSTKSVFEEAGEALAELNMLKARVDELTDEISSREDYESREYTDLIIELSHVNDRLKYLGNESIDAEIEQILLGLGFTRNDFTRGINEFSGGWQMRVEIAKLLLRKPDLILLDEPTNHLDIESIRWLENFLKNYAGALMLVSHDRKFLDMITNRTIEIIKGKIYDMPYNYSQFMQMREEMKEQELSAYKNQQKMIAQQERFIERFRSKNSLATRVQSKIKQLEKMDKIEIDDESLGSMRIRFPEPPRSGRLVAETKGLSKSYGDNLVLKNIDFEIERGEKIAFVGKNGEGKSTFSRILAHIEDYSGELKIGHNVITSFFAQHQAQLMQSDSSVFDEIDAAATGDMRSQVRSLLGAFLFSGDDVYKKVKVLSGGEKSRLALAKMMLEPINFLILDEPTNHLDMLSKDILKQALNQFSGALIVVSHDRDFLQGLTDKTIEFKNQGIIEYKGDINYFLEKKQIDEIDEIELDSKKGARNTNNNTGNAKLDREKRKEFQREENKIKKAIKNAENKIEEIESKMKKYDALFKDPELYHNAEKTQNVNAEYDKLKTELDAIMSEWAEKEEELGKLQSRFDG